MARGFLTDNPNYIMPDEGAPRLLAINPTSAVVGGSQFTLRVIGSNFTPDAQVYFNNGPEPTTFVSDTELTIGVDPATASGGITVPVKVGIGETYSNERNFTFEEASPK